LAGLVDPQGNPVGGTSPNVRVIRPGYTSSQTTQRIQQQQQQQQPQASSPGRQNLDAGLTDLSKVSSDLDNVNKKLDAVLQHMTTELKDSNKEITKMMRGLRDVISDSTDIESNFKEMIRLQKDLAKSGIFDDRSRSAVMGDVEKMKRKWGDLAKASTDTKFQQVHTKALDDIDKLLAQIEKSKKEAFDPTEIEELTKGLKKATDQLDSMLNVVVNIKTASQQLSGTFKTLGGTFLGKNKFVSAINQHYDRQEEAQQGIEKFKKLGKERKEANEAYIASKGGPEGALRGYSSDRGGMRGMLDNRLAAIGAKNPTGFIGRTALTGNGSFIGGIGSKLAGGIEGGASSLLQFGSRMSGPLMAAQALAAIYDANIEKNKKVNELAGGGIYGGDQDIDKVMMGLRTSLSSSSIMEQGLMGQSMDKNIDIMKSLISGGRSVQDVDGQDFSTGGTGFYGSVMKNAVYGGSPIGLSQDESVKLQLKALDEYQATLDQVDEFFVSIGKSTKAAGLSTGKYLEIVEAVSNNFDNMNKSLNTTVNLLNALSRSGRLTGDRMKEVLTTLTGNQIKSPEMRMFGLSQMGAEGRNNLINNLNRETDTAHSALRDTLTKNGIDVSGMKNIGEYEDALRKKYDSGQLDQKTYQTLVGNIKNYRDKVSNNSIAADAIRRGDYATAAGVGEVQGTGSVMNMANLFGTMSGFASATGTNIGSLLSSDVKTRAGASKSYLAYSLANGISGTDAQNTLDAARSYASIGANTTLSMGAKGGLSKDYMGKMMTDLSSRGYVDLPKGASADELQEMFIDLMNGKTKLKGDKILSDALTELPSVLNAMSDGTMDMVELDKKKAQKERDDKTKAIAVNTKTTADLFAQSFEYLFAKVINAVGEMISLLKVLTLSIGGTSEEDAKRYKKNAVDAWQNLGSADPSAWGDKQDVARFKELQVKAQSGSLTDEEYKEMYELAKKNKVSGDGMVGAAKYIDALADNTPDDDKKGNLETALEFLKEKGVVDTKLFSLSGDPAAVAEYTAAMQQVVKDGTYSVTPVTGANGAQGVVYQVINNSVPILGNNGAIPNSAKGDGSYDAKPTVSGD
jgi:hypothetical protein